MTLLHVKARGLDHRGSIWQNSFYLETTGDVGVGDEILVAQDVRDYIERTYGLIENIVYTTYQALDFIVTVVNLINGVEAFFTEGLWTFAPTNAAQALPSHDAAKLRFPGVGNKRGRLLSIAGLTENDNFQGAWAATGLVALANFAGSVILPPVPTGGVTYQPIGWSKANLATFDLTGAVIIDDFVRTQDSRGVNRGQ